MAVRSQGLPTFVISSVLVLAALGAFGPVLGNGFVAWDDPENFLTNPNYRGLSRASIAWAWTTFHLGVYQPLAWMLYSAEYTLGGLGPRAYHMTSLLLHAAVGVALYALAVRLVRRARPEGSPAAVRTACLLATAVFVVHPLRTETVAWASCQGYLSWLLLGILAALAYERSRPVDAPPRVGWSIASVVLYLASLLGHATSIGLPLGLVALDFYPLRRRPGVGPEGRRVLLEKWPYLLVACVFSILAYHAKGRSVQPIERFGPGARLAQAGYGTIYYLAKTLAPYGLHAHHPLTPGFSLSEPMFLLTLGLAVGLTLLAVARSGSWPGLASAWITYLALLSPNSGLVTFGHQLVADRYSYLSTIPWAILAACLLARPMERRRWLVLALALPSLLWLTILCRRQCQTWHDSISLWTNVMAWDETSPAAHLNLANLLSLQRRDAEALHHYQMAGRYDPTSPDPYFNSAILLARAGRFDQVGPYLDEARRRGLPAQDADAWLGMVLSDMGCAEALEHAERAYPRPPGPSARW